MADDDTCRIKVICRVRPLNAKEIRSGSTVVTSFPSEKCVGLANRVFNYDHVLRPTCTQLDVYSLAAQPLVKDVLSGYNATIFAYGQTASGKTHTMEGVPAEDNMQGIIPRIVDNIFEHIYSMDSALEIHIKVSYFEIYMERVRDLLDDTKINLPIGENKNRVPYVKGVTERFVTSPEEVLAVFDEGKSGRHVSVTNMNAHSSRSHAVFLISIKQENRDTHKTLTGKLYLVDLAGSEKVDKTNAQGLTLEEAKTINKSLLSLSNVISALAEGNKPYIPYRDSKLTRVLQESLGGNARTTLVICCSPSSFNQSETKSTLMFGDRAKTVKNVVAVNVELTAEEWRQRYEKQRAANSQLKALVDRYEKELQRWRRGDSVPPSEQASGKVRQDATAASSPLLAPPPSNAPATPTPAEVRAFEEDRAKLYQQLDEKDEELQTQTELVEKLTMSLQDMEDKFQSSQREAQLLNDQIEVVELEMVSSQNEVREVMQALEELAVSYDSKDREIEAAHTEQQLLQEEVGELKHTMDTRSRELNDLREVTHVEKRKNQERISTLFRDLNEVGSVLGNKTDDRLRLVDSSATAEMTEENFTRARIHLSNLRCEARTLTQQRDVLERAELDARSRAQSAIKELSGYRLKMSQFETQNASLSVRLCESEVRKQELEETLRTLNHELASLREEPEGGGGGGGGEGGGVGGAYLSQVEGLRGEMEAKERQITHLNKEYETQVSTVEGLRAELEEVGVARDSEERRYSQVRLQARVRERARHDLGGLTDTVSRELDRLNKLRHSYLHHMTSRIKSKSVDDERITMATSDRREVQFLERNLDELSRAHKKTISENAELHREVPRLHAVLASKSKRIGELEHYLRETKDTASHEFERLKKDNEKLQQSFMAKLKEKEREYQHGKVIKRQGGPTLARPVPRGRSDSTSREALLAGAGVAVIGQRKKPLQLQQESVLDGSHASGGSSQ